MEYDSLVIAVREQVQAILDTAPLSSSFRTALNAALTLPGNLLSGAADMRWARIVATCCVAAGGTWTQAIPVAAAVELHMIALDVLDDVEDNEASPLHTELGVARSLNVSTGLLMLAQYAIHQLCDSEGAASLLVNASLQACSGQDNDLATVAHQARSLEDALVVAATKSAPLVAVACQLGAHVAGADESLQDQYAAFGTQVGLVAQLANDLHALFPTADGKTDIALRKPTLPLVYAAVHNPAGPHMVDDELKPSESTQAGMFLTWAVADVYRRRALELVPQLTHDHEVQRRLEALLPQLS